MKWICVLISLAAVLIAGPGSGTDSERPVFSLDVRDEALADVLEQISEASGYAITLRGEHDESLISLKLKDITLEEMLRRILWKSNYTMIWNESEKKVLLSIYPGSAEPSGRTLSNDREERRRRATNPMRTFSGHEAETERGMSGRGEYPGVSISGRHTRFVQATDTTD